MKKIFFLSILVLLVTGCSSIENDNIDNLISITFTSKVSTKNVNRNGFRYYLPKGLSVKTSKSFNDVLSDQQYLYYLYVDVVSYNNQTDFSYTANEEAYYSQSIENNGKKGYIEVNNYKNNQYLIEIMYNYAKMEVIVYERDINKAMSYAMVILTSIAYNDDVIKNYLSNNVFDSVEESFDIFEIIGSENYLQFAEEEEVDEGVNDPDYID